MTNLSRSSRSRWFKRLLLFIRVVMIAGVLWRVLPVGKKPGSLPQGAHSGPPGRAMMGGGAPLVHSGVATIADEPVYLSALGIVIPNASVTVTSRVDGQLEKFYFTEGQKVEAGQLLAQIDPRSFEATLPVRRRASHATSMTPG
ncbi:biotin/lipoyl-binding protein [Pantoea sp. KPR_PJ]